MNDQLKAYLRIEVIVSAAFNFFINGFIASLIYHKADYVPTDSVSLAIDLLLTCLFILTLGSFFSAASLRRAGVSGILDSGGRLIKLTGRFSRRPLLFGAAAGLTAAVVLTALTTPVIVQLNISEIPFWIYIAVKPIFSAFLGGGATLLELYIGMCSGK